MALTVRAFAEGDRAGWDAYVDAHPQGSPFHLTAWMDCIAASFGYEPRYLVAVNGTEIEGVLPLFLTSSLMSGKALISTPFAVYGGILAQDPTAREAIREHLERMAEELAVQFVDLRNRYPEQGLGYHAIDRYATFVQPLVPTEEELLKMQPKKTRNLCKKAAKQEIVEKRGVADTRVFNELHSRTMRRLGTPAFPPKHFARLKDAYGDKVDVSEFWHQDKPVAVSLSFLYKEDFHIYYAATDNDFNHVVPNIYMYMRHMLWAGQNGFSTYDFGRCKKGAGTFDFKKRWATEMVELPYEIKLVRQEEVPNLSPTNKKFELAIKVWQRLPLPLTRAVGPHLIKLFP